MMRLPRAFNSTERAIFTNAGTIVSTTGVTSLLGYFYWLAAARAFSPHALGLATATIAALSLIANLSAFGLGTLLIAEIARRPGRAKAMLLAGLVLSLAWAALLSILFLFIAPVLTSDFSELRASFAGIALVIAGGVFSTAALVIDQSVLGLLRGHLQLLRNTMFSVIKLMFVVVIGLTAVMLETDALLATWIAAIGLSLVLLVPAAGPLRVPLADIAEECGRLIRHARTAAAHHVLNLALLTPGLLLPLIVTAVLSAEMNAYFYIAWLLAAFIFTVPGSLATTVYAAAANAPETLPARLRLTLSASFMLGLAGLIAIITLSPAILGFFGPAYRAQAGDVLFILGFGVFPLIIKDHYITIRRVGGQVESAAALIACGSVIEVTAATLGGLAGGLPGIALGWIGGVAIEALAVVVPVLRASAGGRRSATSDRRGESAGVRAVLHDI